MQQDGVPDSVAESAGYLLALLRRVSVASGITEETDGLKKKTSDGPGWLKWGE
jgi:hypothetical protein